MMAHKRLLHELLKEDQEPFVLNKYISDRRSQLKRRSPNTSLQLKKPKPIHHNSSFPANFCKNACFFSFRNTPELLNSPLFEFASPAKSPAKSPNAIFLHIPARTAALLLEAALRIQKQSSSSKTHKTNGFGLFGSLFKRLTQPNRKREIQGGGVNGSRKEEEEMASEKGKNDFSVRTCEVAFPCSYNGRSSSAVWSETNEDKSLDMETSSSSQSDDSDEIDFVSKREHVTDCACCDPRICESPFRFVLKRSPSSGRQTPEFASPALSPGRHRTQDKGKNGTESLEKFESGEEEEEKEQCSPVSVLDPPFEDDEDGHENHDEADGFDLECSYAIVQKAKQQLLYKLRSFEKLAELDPVELEKRMMEEDDEEDECEDDQRETSEKEKGLRGSVLEVLWESSLHDRRQIPEDLRRLVSDLIMEEEGEANSSDEKEMVIRRVCERLELWKEVESNTIDMMIEHDLCKEDGKWKKNEEQIKEVAREVELAIFGLLVEEFSEELVC